MAKKMCAVCKSKTQSNIVFKWQRHSDSKVFHICAECVELHKVNSKTVQEVNGEYKSFMTAEEFEAERCEVANKIFRRAKGAITVGEYVRQKTK